jgi:hypothetical protein
MSLEGILKAWRVESTPVGWERTAIKVEQTTYLKQERLKRTRVILC